MSPWQTLEKSPRGSKSKKPFSNSCSSRTGWSCPPRTFISSRSMRAWRAWRNSSQSADSSTTTFTNFRFPFRPAWGVWVDKVNYVDLIWGLIPPCWRDTERFHGCARIGSDDGAREIRSTHCAPAYHVRLWKQQINEHKKLANWGGHTTEAEMISGVACWLCQFERLHGGEK